MLFWWPALSVEPGRRQAAIEFASLGVLGSYEEMKQWMLMGIHRFIVSGSSAELLEIEGHSLRLRFSTRLISCCSSLHDDNIPLLRNPG